MKIFIEVNKGVLYEVEGLDGIENFEFYKTPPREKVVEEIREALKALGVEEKSYKPFH